MGGTGRARLVLLATIENGSAQGLLLFPDPLGHVNPRLGEVAEAAVELVGDDPLLLGVQEANHEAIRPELAGVD